MSSASGGGAGGSGGAAEGKPDYGGYRPHYQGFGATTQGGRGGEVCVVNQLGSSGAGSLRDCVERTGPRFVLFEVSGNIHDDVLIRNPYITIAGQTAPSPGITLSGSLTIDTNDVVVQHLRLRGSSWGTSTFYVGYADGGDNTNVHHVVLDHLSLSWSHGVSLGGISPGGAHDVLMIDSIASEGLSLDYYYPESCGGIPGETANCAGAGVLLYAHPDCSATLARNAFIHLGNRNPWISVGCDADVYNNLAYNAHTLPGPDNVTGFMQIVGLGPHYWPVPVDVAYVGNVSVPGPDTFEPDGSIGVMLEPEYLGIGNRLYLFDNAGPGIEGPSGDGQWAGVYYDYFATEAEIRSDTPPAWATTRSLVSSSQVQAAAVANAGARPVDRDPVDARVIEDVTQGDGTNHIANVAAVGGLPPLAENVQPISVPPDAKAIAPGQTFRTNIEVWLEDLACALEPACM